MSDAIVYGPGFSTYVRSVLLALEEKGADYSLEEVNMMAGAHKKPAHLARHPFGKVPVFEHDGFALYEAAAIMRYVDAVFEGPHLQPSEPRARARMDQALSVIDSYVYPALVSKIIIPRNRARMRGKSPDEAALAEALPAAKVSLDALEALLDGNSYFGGNAVSLADLHLAPVYEYFSQTPEGEKLLADMPKLADWWREMSQRASLEKTRPSLG